jgi:ACS family pantothenate transporter-like MFS transporter
MVCAACKTYAQLGVVRFAQGFFESSLYSGTIYILGSWYKPQEIAKRTAIFTAIGQIGSMAAGVMMTAMNQSLDGTGLHGWQWVFIINGAMGIPFGIFGLMFFPNLPETTSTIYLSADEISFAIARLPPKIKSIKAEPLTALVFRLAKSPHLYILTAYSALACALEAIVLQGLFLLYLRENAAKFPVYAPTTYPLGVQAVSIFSNIGAGYVIDITNQRIPMVILAGVLQLVVASLLLVRDISTAGAFTAFYLAGTSYIVNPLLYGWASVICQRAGDDASRSVVLYSMSLVQAVLYTFWGVVLYPATDAPYWQKGCVAMIVVVFAFFAGTVAVVWVSLPQGQREKLLTLCSLIGRRGVWRGTRRGSKGLSWMPRASVGRPSKWLYTYLDIYYASIAIISATYCAAFSATGTLWLKQNPCGHSPRSSISMIGFHSSFP